MRLEVLRFACLLLVAVSMAGGLAHVFSLPQKIDLSEDEYFTVQQVYRGWALLGIPLFGSLFGTVCLAALLHRRHKHFGLTAISAALLATGLVLFFSVTFPANQQTQNWTAVPENWEQLRRQWEYSHAAQAALVCAAFICLAWQTVHVPKRTWDSTFSVRLL